MAAWRISSAKSRQASVALTLAGTLPCYAGRRNPLKALGSVAYILANVIFYWTNDRAANRVKQHVTPLFHDLESLDLILCEQNLHALLKYAWSVFLKPVQWSEQYGR